MERESNYDNDGLDPSEEYSIASKETWEKLTKNQRKYGLGNPKNYYG